MDEERAGKLARLLFTHIIHIKNRKICQVAVDYGLSSKEYRYPVSDGMAAVPLYGDDYKILLEDRAGNRFTVSEPFREDASGEAAANGAAFGKRA